MSNDDMKHSRVRFGKGAEEARTQQKLCGKCCFNGVLLWKAAVNVLCFKELTLTISGRRYLLDSSTLTYSLQISFSRRDVGYVDRIKQSCWVICQQQNWEVEEREVALSQHDKIPWLNCIFTSTTPVLCATILLYHNGKSKVFIFVMKKSLNLRTLGLSQTKHQLSQNLWPWPAVES